MASNNYDESDPEWDNNGASSSRGIHILGLWSTSLANFTRIYFQPLLYYFFHAFILVLNLIPYFD